MDGFLDYIRAILGDDFSMLLHDEDGDPRSMLIDKHRGYRINSSSTMGKRLLLNGSTLRQSFLKPSSPRMQSGTIPSCRGLLTGLSSSVTSDESSYTSKNQDQFNVKHTHLTDLWALHSSKPAWVNR